MEFPSIEEEKGGSIMANNIENINNHIHLPRTTLLA